MSVDRTHTDWSSDPPIQVSTKAEATYAELRSRILGGSIDPGSTVNQEALATALGVSITPLREALRRLESEGLVTLEAHRTMTIAPLTSGELEDLYAVRLRLDPFAARLAAASASAPEVRDIARLARTRLNRDPQTALADNRAFHRAVYSACHNVVLVKILDQLWNSTDRYRLILLREQIVEKAAAREHRAIAAALAARDGNLVHRLVEAHVTTAMHLIQLSGVNGER
jgi:DNA-binding GntR family transcriptional regulator